MIDVVGRVSTQPVQVSPPVFGGTHGNPAEPKVSESGGGVGATGCAWAVAIARSENRASGQGYATRRLDVRMSSLLASSRCCRDDGLLVRWPGAWRPIRAGPPESAPRSSPAAARARGRGS